MCDCSNKQLNLRGPFHGKFVGKGAILVKIRGSATFELGLTPKLEKRNYDEKLTASRDTLCYARRNSEGETSNEKFSKHFLVFLIVKSVSLH